MSKNRPKVVVLASASIDGRVTMSPDSTLLYGDERWKSLESTSQFSVFEWLKAEYNPQATLEGSGSFVPRDTQPDPLPGIEGGGELFCQDFLPQNIIHRPEHRGWFTAVDSRGRIRWLYKEYPDPAWEGWYALVLVARQTPVEYLAYLRSEDIPYLVAGVEQVDLGRALEKMRSELGVECLISTAGGKLNGSLLRAGLVDEINLEFLPAVIGAMKRLRYSTLLNLSQMSGPPGLS